MICIVQSQYVGRGAPVFPPRAGVMYSTHAGAFEISTGKRHNRRWSKISLNTLAPPTNNGDKTDIDNHRLLINEMPREGEVDAAASSN